MQNDLFPKFFFYLVLYCLDYLVTFAHLNFSLKVELVLFILEWTFKQVISSFNSKIKKTIHEKSNDSSRFRSYDFFNFLQ